jgi:hypothetical protein
VIVHLCVQSVLGCARSKSSVQRALDFINVECVESMHARGAALQHSHCMHLTVPNKLKMSTFPNVRHCAYHSQLVRSQFSQEVESRFQRESVLLHAPHGDINRWEGHVKAKWNWQLL